INPKPGDLPEVFSYIDLESVKNGVLLQEKIIKKEEAPSRAQRLLEEKDILFQTVRPYQRNNYFFNSKSPTVASTGYAQFRVNKNNYPSFLYQYLYTNNFVKNVLDRCSGTSFPAISTNDLLEISLHIPSLAEQQKIADFLSNVDSIITAETKILNTLQKKKKALMQKLFTRQLRFKSDDGKDFPAWEEKKLGECVEILDSQRKPIESKERANRKGEYPYYGASGIIDYIDDYLFEGESILLGEDGANIINRNSRLAFIATGKYWVNNHAHIMKTNADNLNHFICEYLESLDYSKICAGSAQPKLTQDVIRNLTIKAPCKEEQQKIADCLSSLDSLIQTQQKVVTTWQQRKKALLQQMFI
ncbi:MAG: restriction endonuclease subunit S, partial [Treponema sp.]|nr:restriction endonuclease subunit S [Treponema sp.]